MILWTQETNQYAEEVSKIVTYEDKKQYLIDAVEEGNREKTLAVALHFGAAVNDLERHIKQAAKNDLGNVVKSMEANITGFVALEVFNIAVDNGSAESALAISTNLTRNEELPPMDMLKKAAKKGMLPVIEAFNNADMFKNYTNAPVYDELIKTAMDNATPEEINRHHKAQDLHALGVALTNISPNDVDTFHQAYGGDVADMLADFEIDSKADKPKSAQHDRDIQMIY